MSINNIKNRLSRADKIEESILQSLLRGETLRHNILKKVFNGELI